MPLEELGVGANPEKRRPMVRGDNPRIADKGRGDPPVVDARMLAAHPQELGVAESRILESVRAESTLLPIKKGSMDPPPLATEITTASLQAHEGAATGLHKGPTRSNHAISMKTCLSATSTMSCLFVTSLKNLTLGRSTSLIRYPCSFEWCRFLSGFLVVNY